MDFLKEQNIQTYSFNSDIKAVFVERFNGTLLDLIKEPMYIEGKACWLNHIDAAMEKYNNRVHGTTKTAPFETSTNNELVPILIFKNNIENKSSKFEVGDFVRDPDKRNLYSEGFK